MGASGRFCKMMPPPLGFPLVGRPTRARLPAPFYAAPGPRAPRPPRPFACAGWHAVAAGPACWRRVRAARCRAVGRPIASAPGPCTVGPCLADGPRAQLLGRRAVLGHARASVGRVGRPGLALLLCFSLVNLVPF